MTVRSVIWMENFMVVVAQVVGAAVAQEAVSRTVSFVLGKRKERASQGQYLERLTKAVHDVEFVLERTAKLAITEFSLLRDRIQLKRDFIQAACLLRSRHKKRQAPQGQQEVMPAVTCSSSPQGLVTRPAMFAVSDFISMSKDDLCLSSDNVEIFERFAESAGNILAHVESGCSLRHRMCFSSPLVSHLFEGKTLRYRMVEADQDRKFVVWPGRLDGERGVEAWVRYEYLDHKRPEKCFYLWFILRLSESTDIVGVAIDCLQSLASQFNFVADTAIEELTLLASNLQDVSHSHAPPWVGIQEQHNEFTQLFRPDPLCCKAKGHGFCANNVVSSELSLIFPEEVIFFCFQCYISAPEYSLRSSSKRSVERNRRPLLQLAVCVAPHYVDDELQQTSYAVEEIGDNTKEHIDVVSMQEAGKTIRSRALDCFLRQPKVTTYRIRWFNRHGGITFRVFKLRSGALDLSKKIRCAQNDRHIMKEDMGKRRSSS